MVRVPLSSRSNNLILFSEANCCFKGRWTTRSWTCHKLTALHSREALVNYHYLGLCIKKLILQMLKVLLAVSASVQMLRKRSLRPSANRWLVYIIWYDAFFACLPNLVLFYIY